MTDQQLIDRTATSIAADLTRHGIDRHADSVVLYENGLVVGVLKRSDIAEVAAKHLTAMLAMKQEAELAAIERILFDEPEQSQ